MPEHEHEPEATEEESDGNALRIVSRGPATQLMPLSNVSQISGSHVGHRHPSVTRPKKTDRDLGILGVLIHVLGDAINNVGVIISALVIWLAHYPGRFYADPGVSTGIALMILASAVPLGKGTHGLCEAVLTCNWQLRIAVRFYYRVFRLVLIWKTSDTTWNRYGDRLRHSQPALTISRFLALSPYTNYMHGVSIRAKPSLQRIS